MMSSCCRDVRQHCGGLAALSSQLDALDKLAKAAAVAREALSLDDGLENEAPEEFVDPLTAELMKSPVKLPSGNVVDDSTIRQHLLNELSDRSRGNHWNRPTSTRCRTSRSASRSGSP